VKRKIPTAVSTQKWGEKSFSGPRGGGFSLKVLSLAEREKYPLRDPKGGYRGFAQGGTEGEEKEILVEREISTRDAMGRLFFRITSKKDVFSAKGVFPSTEERNHM